MNNYNNKEKTTEIKNILINFVKEKYIADNIISYKEDMEIIFLNKKYKDWVKHKKELEIELSFTNNHIKSLKKIIKQNCKHTNIVQHIYPGFERSEYSYYCNQCCFPVYIHEEFDYKNITKTIEY